MFKVDFTVHCSVAPCWRAEDLRREDGVMSKIQKPSFLALFPQSASEGSRHNVNRLLQGCAMNAALVPLRVVDPKDLDTSVLRPRFNIHHSVGVPLK